MKKVTVVAIGAIVLSGLSGSEFSAIGAAQAADKVSWNLSTWGKRRAFTEGAEAMAAYVADKSGGNFTITMNYGGTLSKPRENLDGISLGAFEMDPFGNGTFAVAKTAADLASQGKLVAVAGGGDTVAALNAAGVTDKFTYVSTAGGAFLEWLEGRELPGVAALLKNQESARKDGKLEEVR